MDNKKLADSSLVEKVKENSAKLEQLQKRVEELENPGAHENKDVEAKPSNYAEKAILDINNKLSNYAQKAAQDSRGPLKPDELLMHFTSNDFGKKKKEAMAVIKKIPNNIDGVKNQLSYILEHLEIQVTRRKQENELDVQLIQRIRKFNETLEKEQEKRKKSNTMLNESHNVTTRSKDKFSSAEIAGKSYACKETMPVKQAEKRGRKRKWRNDDDEDDDSFSSQAIEVGQVADKCGHFSINSPTATEQNIQSNPVSKSGAYTTYRLPEPLISSASSSQSSTASSSQSSTGTEGYYADADSAESSTGKRSKQSECNGEEETFPEKYFILRSKTESLRLK